MAETDISAWCECSELWNKLLLGNGFCEDEKIIAKALASIAKSQPRDSSINVIELGNGSTRVVTCLQSTMQKIKGRQFTVYGIQPSTLALNRVQSRWASQQASQETPASSHVTVHWAHQPPTTFTNALPTLIQPQAKADLIIAALGTYHHLLLTDEDTKLFLKQVSNILTPNGGRLVLSFLYDFMPETDPAEFTSFGSVEHKIDTRTQTLRSHPQRMVSRDHPGLVYVKHPASVTTDGAEYGEVRTQRFRLDVENITENGSRSHEVRWDMRVLDGLVLLDHLREAGLQLDRIVDGKVQEIWFVKVRREEML